MAWVSLQNQNGLALANLLLFSIKARCDIRNDLRLWPTFEALHLVATIVPCFYCTVTNPSSITLTLIASWWDGERDSRSGRVTAPRKQSLCLCCGSQEYTSTSSCLLSTNSSSNDSSQSNWSSPVRTWQIKNHVNYFFLFCADVIDLDYQTHGAFYKTSFWSIILNDYMSSKYF